MTPISYSLKAASEATGLSESYLKRAIGVGHLKAKRSGKATDGEPVGKYLILAADLATYVAELADA